jgi:predicted permease
MKALRRFFVRLTASITRGRDERRLREEIEEHLVQQTAENVRAGLSPDEARRQAVLKFGAVEAIKENYRDQISVPSIEQLSQDIHYALRGFRRNPGFAATAVLTLAIAIGANTAMFTLVDQVLLRLLPVRDPQELVLVTTQGSYYGDNWGDGSGLSYPMYAEFRDRSSDVFGGMFARFNWQVQASVAGRADRVSVEFVSGSYFPTLGVNAEHGRTILPSDDAQGEQPVVVLGYRYWLNRLGGDPTLVGKTLVANNQALTIVGIAHEGFDGTNLGTSTQLFVPLRHISALTPVGANRERSVLDDRRIRWLIAFGRLRPGLTFGDAQAILQPLLASQIALEVQEQGFTKASEAEKSRYLKSTLVVRPAGDGKSMLRQQLMQPLWILMGTVAMVLLIACANLANLQLARAIGRQREFAVRLALGASRQRLARQLLVESLVLALAGSALGLVIAMWGADALLRFVPNPGITLTVSVAPDQRILAFTLSLAVLTGIAFGFAPAFQTTRPSLAPTLKNEAGTVVGGSSGRLRRIFMVSQVALSVLLLVGAGLFVRSLHNLMRTQLGFEATSALSFRIDPDAHGYAGARGKAFIKDVRQRLQTTPGVINAAFASRELLSGSSWNNFVTIEAQPFDPDRRIVAWNNAVSPSYFATMGIPLLAGRDFDERDEEISPSGEPWRPRVAIANRTFVQRYLAGKSPLGVRIGWGRDPGTPTSIEIVGVVGDAKYTNVRDDIQPQLFYPLLGGPSVGLVTMYVRTRDDPAPMIRTVQQVVQQIGPTVPIFDVRTLEEQVERSVASDRLIANLSGVFGVLATLLAMIGLYGVMAYTVTRRTREIGIRIALGAITRSISWLVMREVLMLIAIGLAIALPAIWSLTRFVESQLYGITPLDPLTIVLAIALLTVVAIAAGLLPAWRAARVDPLVALRYE